MIFNIEQNIGDIVATMPKASEIFKKYNIDFCCGGNRPLGEAIKEQKLDREEILTKLEEAYNETKIVKEQVDFRNLSSSELIEYIVNTHHSFTKKIMMSISELITTILRVHGLNHNYLFEIHKLFNNLRTELEAHLIKEEEIIFPLIKQYELEPSEKIFSKIGQVINEAEEEHEGAGDILKELRKITQDYEVPSDGCNTFRLTYDKLQELEGDLFEHIHLENNILFKRF